MVNNSQKAFFFCENNLNRSWNISYFIAIKKTFKYWIPLSQIESFYIMCYLKIW